MLAVGHQVIKALACDRKLEIQEARDDGKACCRGLWHIFGHVSSLHFLSALCSRFQMQKTSAVWTIDNCRSVYNLQHCRAGDSCSLTRGIGATCPRWETSSSVLTRRAGSVRVLLLHFLIQFQSLLAIYRLPAGVLCKLTDYRSACLAMALCSVARRCKLHKHKGGVCCILVSFRGPRVSEFATPAEF